MKKRLYAMLSILLAALFLHSCANTPPNNGADITDPPSADLPCFLYDMGDVYGEYREFRSAWSDSPQKINLFGQSFTVSEYSTSNSEYYAGYDLFTADNMRIGTVFKEGYKGTLYDSFRINISGQGAKENFTAMIQPMIQQYLPGSGAIDENTAKQLAWFYHQNLLQEDMKTEITEADFQGIGHDEYNGEIVNHSVGFVLYKNGIQYAGVSVTMDLNGILDRYRCILQTPHPDKIPVFDGEEIFLYCERFLKENGYLNDSPEIKMKEQLYWYHISETPEGDFRFWLRTNYGKLYCVTFEKIPGIKAINETEVAGSSGIEREP